ncbi:MAG: DUF2786 domain-containing protein [Victivallales bacterium]|nr:DUF2786 domain-containing protein [Victivallales bacterium]
MSGKLRPPSFAVSPELKCWGQWQGGVKRCITLNERLLLRHPWYAVQDVLRHEIAHQVVDECGLGADEKPHGKAFRTVCALIGARPDASGDYPTLDQVIFSDDDGTEEGADTPQARMLVKMRKLLALAQSSDVHEAEAALLKAREMAAKYDLELVESGEAESDSDFFRISLGTPRKRCSYEDVMMAHLLQAHFNVHAVWEYVPDEENPGEFLTQLALCGTRSSLRIASYVHDCVSSYITRSLRELPMDLYCRVMRSRKALEDFRQGILRGFISTLEAAPEPVQCSALVLARRQKLEGYIRQLYPRLKKTQRRHRVCDAELNDAGYEAGRRLRIHPGIENNSAPKALGRGTK